MINGKTLSLVIPCKNEQESLDYLLSRVPKYIDEVIVVDNNSSDKTASIAKKHKAIVVSEKRKDKSGIGYGFAHQKGMKIASGEYIITMDGDGTYPLSSIRQIVLKMEKSQLHFVSCNRFPLKNPKVISPMRRVGVWILNLQTTLLYQYPIQDILSGMWVIRRSAIKKLKLKSGGWDFSPEIKLSALMHPEIQFAEYHILHHYRSNGASKQQLWQTGFNHFRFIATKRLIEDNPLQRVYKESQKAVKNTLKTALPELSLE